jgi:predicted histidine transporter YuiF (NhaC family)
MDNQNNSISACQILTPITLLAFVVFLSLGFQTVQVVRDRDALHQAITQQDKLLEDSRKIQAQLTALAGGTKTLADGGDKSAIAIITRLQQNGISVGGPAPGTEGASAPAATPAP